MQFGVTNLYRITAILPALADTTALSSPNKSNLLGLLVLPLSPPQRMSLSINKFLPSSPSPFISLGRRLLLYFLYRLVRIYRSETERFPLLLAGDPRLVDAGRGGAGGVQLPGAAVSCTVSRHFCMKLITAIGN